VKRPSGSELDLERARARYVGVAVLACFAAVAAIAWVVPKGATAGSTAASRHPVEAVTRGAMSDGARAEPAASAAVPAEDPAKARTKPLCAECGIIEAVQRIDMPLKFTGWCDAAETVRTQNDGRAYGRDFRADRESLSETVAAGIAASRASTKDAVITRHRIVVRMRNGSRQIFDESTPRMVNVGDRMVVIAGAPRTNG
jgi:hypothetical protein